MSVKANLGCQILLGPLFRLPRLLDGSAQREWHTESKNKLIQIENSIPLVMEFLSLSVQHSRVFVHFVLFVLPSKELFGSFNVVTALLGCVYLKMD